MKRLGTGPSLVYPQPVLRRLCRTPRGQSYQDTIHRQYYPRFGSHIRAALVKSHRELG